MQPSLDTLPARQRAYNQTLLARAGDLDIDDLDIDGSIPAGLRGGRYLLNGPGWLEIGGRVVHPFDGHGYLRSLRLRPDGGASLRARFVRTDAWKAEAAADRVVYRGLATNPSDRWWENWRAPGPRNVANTTVVPWAGRLLCGWEGGRPHALDATTLETLGEHDFEGALPEGAFLAHMRIDARARRLVGLSLTMGRFTGLTFREFDEAGRPVATREAQLPALVMAHDFFVTPRWYVVAGNLLRMRLGALLGSLMGAGTLLEAVQPTNPEQGLLYLIPRGREGAVRTITLDRPQFVVHFANAHEDGDEVVVDACAFERFSLGQEFGYQGQRAPLDPTIPDQRAAQRLCRARIPPDQQTATLQELSSLGCDFPRVSDALEGHIVPAVYVATRAEPGRSDPFDSLARIDLSAPGQTTVWSAPPNHFVGEPVFAPAPGAADPDEGFVLAMIYDGLGERAELGVFESARLDAGPVARIRLPLLPYGFHGAWEPARP